MIPIFIICRDRVRALRELVFWLEEAGHERIVLIDNASTYPPLLQYLSETGHNVVRLEQNWGAHVMWERAPIPPELTFDDFRNRARFTDVVLREPYVVTDPDCVPTEACPMDLVDHLNEILEAHRSYDKVGPGFYLDDIPPHCPYLGHERLLQSNEIAPGLYDSAIDTTFALYRPGWPFGRRAIRTGYPYQVRHLCPSYYLTPPDEEDRYYHEHARKDPSGSTWVRKTVLA